MEQTSDAFDLDRPLWISVALQPTIFGSCIDKTKAELAYGAWGIPKLVRSEQFKENIYKL